MYAYLQAVEEQLLRLKLELYINQELKKSTRLMMEEAWV